MENELVKLATSQGLYATMFVCLLIYVFKTNKEESNINRKTNEEREKRYQETIDKLVEKFGVVEDIQKDVAEIKEAIKK